MKKIILPPLFLFLLACHNKPAENNTLPTTNNAHKDYSADSTKKWTRNIDTTQRMVIEGNRDTVNYTDVNKLKQGKWIIFDAKGQPVKTEYYKNGKLIDPPK